MENSLQTLYHQILYDLGLSSFDIYRSMSEVVSYIRNFNSNESETNIDVILSIPFLIKYTVTTTADISIKDVKLSFIRRFTSVPKGTFNLGTSNRNINEYTFSMDLLLNLIHLSENINTSDRLFIVEQLKDKPIMKGLREQLFGTPTTASLAEQLGIKKDSTTQEQVTTQVSKEASVVKPLAEQVRTANSSGRQLFGGQVTISN